MGAEGTLVKPQPAASSQMTGGAKRFLQSYPRLTAALVLWVASWAFVSAFSVFARWETGATYFKQSDLCRWDCGQFASVLRYGYPKTPQPGTGFSTWLFHPLLPMLAYPLDHWFGLSAEKSLVLVSEAGFLLAIYAFLLMVSKEEQKTGDYLRIGALVAFHPYLIYAHAGYSESLYFALLCLAFYFAERARWILSGSMGALVSATRMPGFLFSGSYLLFAVGGWKFPNYRRNSVTKLVGLLLCPLGTALYMLYLHARTGDALAQVHNHLTFINAPPGNPLMVLHDALIGHHWWRVWGVMCVGAILAGVYLFRIGKSEYGVYLLLAIAMSLSGGAYGMPRYLWWQPPLMYAIYEWLRRHPAWWTPYLAFASGMAAFMVVEWFSGHNFVV